MEAWSPVPQSIMVVKIPRRLGMDALENLDQVKSQMLLTILGQGFRAIGIDEGDFVFRGVEADTPTRNVVCNDEVAILSQAFTAGVFDDIFGFGGEANQGALEAHDFAGRTKNVFGTLEGEGHFSTKLLELLFCNFSRSVIGDGGGKNSEIVSANLRLHRLIHVGGAFDREIVDSFRDFESGWAGDEKNGMPPFCRRCCERVTHFAGGAIGEIADRIDGLHGWAGSDEDLHVDL